MRSSKEQRLWLACTIMSSNYKDLPVSEVVEILECNRSYAYRLIKSGRLEVTSKSPLKVTATSLAKLLCRGNQTLLKSISSIQFNIANQQAPTWQYQ
jgi:hypothetical protein